jgi:hypothetical protein
MTGNRQELGGSFGLGTCAGPGTARYSSPATGSSGREPESSERSYVCALSSDVIAKDWRSEQ